MLFKQKSIKDRHFRLSHIGYTDRVFSESTIMPGTISEALHPKGRDRRFVLQSLPEAAAVRLEACGQDYADRAQLTRTLAAFYRDAEGLKVAYDHEREESKNPILCLAGSLRLEGRELKIDKQSEAFRGIMKRATANGDIHPLPEGSLEWRVREGRYGADAHARSLFEGGVLAQDYLFFLESRDHSGLTVTLPDSWKVTKAIGKNDALIRAMVLGGEMSEFPYATISAQPLDALGVSRGVYYDTRKK